MGNLLEAGGGASVSALTGMWRGVYRKAAQAAEARLQQLLAEHVYAYHGRRAVVFVADASPDALTPGPGCDVELPWGYVLEAWSLYADQPGSAVLDLRLAGDYAAFPPGAGASICGSTKPTLASAQKAQALALTGWDTALPRGAVLRPYLESADAVTRLSLSLFVRPV